MKEHGRVSRSVVLSLFSVMLALLAVFITVTSHAAVKTEGGLYVVDGATGRAAIKDGNKAAAREAAKYAACVDALEKVIGACAGDLTKSEAGAAVRKRLIDRSASLVKGFKASGERVDNGVLTLSGTCRVSESAFDAAFGPELIKLLGNPRIMLLVDEAVGDQRPFVSATEGAALTAFEKAGYLIVDPDQARSLLNLDPSAAFSDPAKLAEAAATLKADIIVVGRAQAAPFAEQKLHGVTLYGVKGTVQLKAVLARTAYQISSKTIEQATGKKPALSVGEGAERCFRQAASLAAGQLVNKIAYSMASAGSALGGTTVNIKIVNIPFSDVQRLEDGLRDFAGIGGELFERSYSENRIELDLVSEKSARDIAAFLSDEGINIDGYTAQTVSGTAASGAAPVRAASPGSVISIQLTGVQSFEEEKIIEAALREMMGSAGSVSGEYDGKTNTLRIQLSYTMDAKTAKDIASYLNRPDIKALEPDFEELKKHRVIGITITETSANSVSADLPHSYW